MVGAETRLAAYGTLQPSQSNHHQMDGMTGTWRRGTVRGHLHASGWGAAIGFPGLVADPDGPEIPVHVFESLDLPPTGPGSTPSKAKAMFARPSMSAWMGRPFRPKFTFWRRDRSEEPQMAEIINLRTVRKRKARVEEEVKASENRILFGRTKSEKRIQDAEKGRAEQHLDAHKRDE